MMDLYLGDCVEKFKEIKSDSIHAIISDIPYGINFDDWDVLHKNTNSALGGTSESQSISIAFKRRGKPLNGWSKTDKNIGNEYFEWCKTWATDCLRVLKDGGSCFIFAGRREAHQCINAMESVGFTFRDMIAWVKPQSFFKAQQVSKVFERRKDNINVEKWKGWRLGNLAPDFEPILWFQKPYKIGGTLTDNLLENGVGAFYSPERTSNVFYSKGNIRKKLHPTQKPLDVLEWLILLVTQENQVVLDMFMGSGSTGLACLNTNRNFIGFELNEDYFNIAKERLENV